MTWIKLSQYGDFMVRKISLKEDYKQSNNQDSKALKEAQTEL